MTKRPEPLKNSSAGEPKTSVGPIGGLIILLPFIIVPLYVLCILSAGYALFGLVGVIAAAVLLLSR